jgi:hypothetical protein
VNLNPAEFIFGFQYKVFIPYQAIRISGGLIFIYSIGAKRLFTTHWIVYAAKLAHAAVPPGQVRHEQTTPPFQVYHQRSQQ